MKPLPFAAETRAILRRIRSTDRPLYVFGQSHSRIVRPVKARTERRINSAGVALQNVNVYRRYVHELVKAFRKETGERLAQAIELTIRKWSNFGLEPALLQGLLKDVFVRLEQQGYAMPEARPPAYPAERGPGNQRRRPRTYGDALKRGRVALRRGSSVAEQAARQSEGAAHAARLAEGIRPLLAAKGIPGREFLAYFNFAQELGRLARSYSGKSLVMAAGDLLDRCEAKSLDGDTLRSVAAGLFGINLTT